MSSAKKTALQAGKQNSNFEQSFARLEKLVSLMEEETLSLDDLLQHYQEAQQLIFSCQEMLEVAEARIEELSLPPFPESVSKNPSEKASKPEESNHSSRVDSAEPQSDDNDISLF